MSDQCLGYIRVSNLDQNPQRQMENIQLSRVFTDKTSSEDTKRPQFEELLKSVLDGDTIVVRSKDRLARNLDDVHSMVQKLTSRLARIELLIENLFSTGEGSPLANLMLSVIGAFAEAERAHIGERQREGTALAKKRGSYRRREKALSAEQEAELARRAAAGDTKAALAREYGILDPAGFRGAIPYSQQVDVATCTPSFHETAACMPFRGVDDLTETLCALHLSPKLWPSSPRWSGLICFLSIRPVSAPTRRPLTNRS